MTRKTYTRKTPCPECGITKFKLHTHACKYNHEPLPKKEKEQLTQAQKRERWNRYRKKWRENKTQEELKEYYKKSNEQRTSFRDAELKRIDQAIALLQKHGYKITQ